MQKNSGAMQNGDGPEGDGVKFFTYEDGGNYRGECAEDGKRHGQGTYTYPNGDVFTGTFVMGKRQGHGTYIHQVGGRFEGGWMNDTMHGHGKFVFQSGTIYEGAWFNNNQHGTGKLIEADGVYAVEYTHGKILKKQKMEKGAEGGGGWWQELIFSCAPLTNAPPPIPAQTPLPPTHPLPPSLPTSQPPSNTAFRPPFSLRACVSPLLSSPFLSPVHSLVGCVYEGLRTVCTRACVVCTRVCKSSPCGRRASREAWP